MDIDEAMEQERRRYIAAAIAGQDDDWAQWGDACADLAALGSLVLMGKHDEAAQLVGRLIASAADAHVEKMDDLGRFDEPDIVAAIRAAQVDMPALVNAIRNVK